MPDTHEMVKGDLTAELTVTLLQSDNKTPVQGLDTDPLPEITFVMTADHLGTPVINYVAAVWVDASLAKAKYSWTSGDTDVAGRFLARFRIKVAGKFQHFPNKKRIVVNINEP